MHFPSSASSILVVESFRRALGMSGSLSSVNQLCCSSFFLVSRRCTRPSGDLILLFLSLEGAGPRAGTGRRNPPFGRRLSPANRELLLANRDRIGDCLPTGVSSVEAFIDSRDQRRPADVSTILSFIDSQGSGRQEAGPSHKVDRPSRAALMPRRPSWGQTFLTLKWPPSRSRASDSC